jgi:ankyrin repeat protein
MYTGHSPLHWAALKGHLQACKILLDAGASVNSTDQWHFTPLIRAAQNGHVLVVLLLLRGGADPALVDEVLFTAALLLLYCCFTAGPPPPPRAELTPRSSTRCCSDYLFWWRIP